MDKIRVSQDTKSSPTRADFSTDFGADYSRIAQNSIDLSDLADGHY